MPIAAAVARVVRAHARAAVDLVWPPLCPRCAARAAHPRDQFCEECWAALRPLRSEEREWLLGPEGAEPLSARAAFAVDALFLDALAASKYRLFRDVGRRLAREAARRLAETPPRGTLIPVPLRPDRRRSRGFNQTEDFSRALAAATGARVETSWLVRRRAGAPLAGLPREARAAVVRGAFAAGERFPGEDAGPVLLVDDVVTTGSTAAACAAALRARGARSIGVVAMGRAFASSDGPPEDRSALGRL
jgi:predicted amidophosphoribosyltransferase